VGDTIRIGRVLAHKVNGEFKVGQPYLEDVQVEAEILEEFRGPKVRGLLPWSSQQQQCSGGQQHMSFCGEFQWGGFCLGPAAARVLCWQAL